MGYQSDFRSNSGTKKAGYLRELWSAHTIARQGYFHLHIVENCVHYRGQKKSISFENRKDLGKEQNLKHATHKSSFVTLFVLFYTECPYRSHTCFQFERVR